MNIDALALKPNSTRTINYSTPTSKSISKKLLPRFTIRRHTFHRLYQPNKIYQEFLEKSRWEVYSFTDSSIRFLSIFPFSLSLSDYFLLSFCRLFSPFSSLRHDSNSSARRLSEISFHRLLSRRNTRGFAWGRHLCTHTPDIPQKPHDRIAFHTFSRVAPSF